ncbi:MAG: twin-arginine translocation pathway signal [Alphaproteobacteria bacterium]|nr:MAG: twin-arginine translocation pathway signal [Alphaproteobacteria bacterium]
MHPVIPGRPTGPGPESITTKRAFGFRAPRFARPRNDVIAGAIALFALNTLAASAQTSPRQPEPPVKIEVLAKPIGAFEPRDPSRTRFGALVYRGGIELTSSYREFGGISAIRVAADGAGFLAVTDKGRWLRGRIVYDGTRPAGIVDAEMAPVLGPDGRTLAARGWYDTESIAQDGGTVWLGIERVNRIVRLDVGRDGLLARAHPITVPPGVQRLPHNRGLECLEFVPRRLPLGGTLIAISERGLDRDGNIEGFLLGGPTPGAFSVKRIGDFDVSDCAVTPKGDLLVLERSFSRFRGVGMRIRRVPLASITPGTTVDGPALIEADMGHQIDNMEGLSVHRAANGDLVLTLISDDNFSIIQRTILLQFTLAEP